MKINKNYKPKPFRFKDNFNIDYTPYYIIDDGMYKFFDKVTQYKFMYFYGIMCQCIRVKKDKGFIYCYNNVEINDKQKEFLRKRAIALKTTLPTGTTYEKIECGCKNKKKRQE